MIDKISPSNAQAAYGLTSARKAQTTGKETVSTEDVYTPSEKTAAGKTYSRDSVSLASLQEQSSRAHQQLRRLVEQLLERQGISWQDALASDGKPLVVDETARQEAEAMIGEGGLYSAEAVSDRIVDFAKALSGGDKNKIATLRDAIEEGFRAAAGVLGGELPEISQKTYQMVQEKLDAWANEA